MGLGSYAIISLVFCSTLFISLASSSELRISNEDSAEYLPKFQDRSALIFLVTKPVVDDEIATVKCGGFYWKRNMVITSARCFEGRAKEKGVLKLGVHPFTIYVVHSSKSIAYSARLVKKRGIPARSLYIHKLHNGGNYKANLAVLSLTRSEKKATTVEIGGPPLNDMEKVVLAGFGASYQGGPIGRKLKKVSVYHRDYYWCLDNDKSRFSEKTIMDSRYLSCSSAINVGSDTCGDHGSPVYYRNESNILIAYGIFGIRSEVCKRNAVTWYTNLNMFKTDLEFLNSQSSNREIWSNKIFQVGNWRRVPGDLLKSPPDGSGSWNRRNKRFKYRWRKSRW